MTGGNDDDDALFEGTETRRLEIAEPEPLSRRDRPYLIVLSGAGVGQMFRVDPDGTVLGRGSKADVQLDDDGISRRQARIFEDGGRLIIEDLGSANGTLVNGVRLEGSRPLDDGDKIRLGTTTILKFTYTDDLDESFQREMYNSALRDRLTQAFNRSYLLHRLENEFAYAKRHNDPLGVIMLDVDHFKRVNDTHGHLAGDFVLADIAGRIHETLRSEDVLARYGGEEFCVVCRGTALLGTAQLGERLRNIVAATPFEFESKRLDVTISLGVCSFPEHQVVEVNELVAAADAALVQAKRSGRNRVVVFRR